MKILIGGCRCGHIRYEITEQPWFGFACHCTDCQQLTASAFSLGITVPESGFRLVQNRPQQWTKIGSSGRPSHQFTCPNCSGWTHTKPEVLAGGLVLRPMTLDDRHGILVRSRLRAYSADQANLRGCHPSLLEVTHRTQRRLRSFAWRRRLDSRDPARSECVVSRHNAHLRYLRRKPRSGEP